LGAQIGIGQGDERVDRRRAGMTGQDVEAKGAGQVGHDRARHRPDGSRYLGDGHVGRGDDQQVDACGRARERIPAPQRALDPPAGRGQDTAQRESGPTRADDA
jgi:hypothetical protein